MKTHPFLTALTIINLALLAILFARSQPAQAGGDTSVLRGKSLEIVDDQGRVRASIQLHPAGTANGQAYPETVMLRLIDPNGHPTVKLGGSEQGGGLGLIARSDAVHVILKAEDASATLTLTNRDGQKRLIEP